MRLLLPDWPRISVPGGVASIALYTLFLLFSFVNAGSFLFPDFVNLMIHEAGHMFFSWGGHTLMLLGGTLNELLVPFALAAWFFSQRQTYGFAFCSFWFFENFLYIGTYMADARASALPLVGSDESDWTLLFGQWNILVHDRQIGHFFWFIGWLGMSATILWLARRTWLSSRPVLRPLSP